MGFEELSAQLVNVSSAEAYVRAFATFALKHRELYSVMTKQNYGQFETVPEIRAGVDKVLFISLELLAPKDRSIDEQLRAVAKIWMLVHGGVTLHLSGALQPRSDSDFIEELLAIIGLSEGEKGPSEDSWNTIGGAQDET